MPKRPIFRRKRFLIKKELQFRYIRLVFILALLASLVTGYTVFATGWALLGEKLASVYPQGRLVYVFRTTNIALVRNLLLISPLIFIFALLFSHKIAGPVYRISRDLGEIAKGNLALKIRLRKGDELQDLATEINNMTSKLGSTISSNKEALAGINKELEDIKKRLINQPSDSADIRVSFDNLEKRLKEVSSSLDKWVISS